MDLLFIHSVEGIVVVETKVACVNDILGVMFLRHCIDVREFSWWSDLGVVGRGKVTSDICDAENACIGGLNDAVRVRVTHGCILAAVSV